MKILMVCLGNICRSPLAHGVLAHMVKEKELGWEIDSAGTGNWHIGQCPDKRSVAVAKKYGVDISQQRARQFNERDFARYDHILVMDRQNLRDVVALAKTAEEKTKVKLFLEDGIVPDPYYDDNLFETVYQLVASRCEVLIEELKD
ncbi:low molecular weight phosphotyrosine protein phosphatase [Olivibacter sp. SDN3]|uniref:low molecular weight protein-tyrosine-phosphatase n=1 Tax=Olivibacter sp. SDN3 TaxID=2764720 RepID=UPI0016512DF4|nr:low molecular weight protein-tyrosine-phosphatase [Olivibacter sp. SDN3]QNL50915.1 low molecular weight phosphotyrosine protein phosphatase [Olivibacter sp. SDN3]